MNTYILFSCVEEELEFAFKVRAEDIFEAITRFDFFPDRPPTVYEAVTESGRFERKKALANPEIMAKVKELTLIRYGVDLDKRKVVPVGENSYSEYYIFEVTPEGDVYRYPDTKRGSHVLGKVREVSEKFWNKDRSKNQPAF